MDIIDRIIDWFDTTLERRNLIKNFNKRAEDAWMNGYSGIYLKAKITWGNSANKTNFSRTYSGITILTASGKELDYVMCQMIGTVIMSDMKLCKGLVKSGFDTLEVRGSNQVGYESSLQNYLLESNNDGTIDL